MVRDHPFNGRRAAIATLHGKERVVGPVMKQWFGINLESTIDVDTDALGTFTGEIARSGDMLDAARAKARLAIKETGATVGIGSEGAFGPHPSVPFLASGVEVMVLIDAESDLEIVVQRRTKTNYDSLLFRPGNDLSAFLHRIGFPTHAVIVRPGTRGDSTTPLKGIMDLSRLSSAIDKSSAMSDDGSVFIQTDMRAHMNPTRMKSLGFVARLLALRMARLCPSCSAPGFALSDVLRGVPCEQCGAPTRRIRAEIHNCSKCGLQQVRRMRPETMRAAALWCDICNP